MEQPEGIVPRQRRLTPFRIVLLGLAVFASIYYFTPIESWKIEGIGGPKTTSATCVIFLVPRALGRIVLGSERVSGSQGGRH